jgi:pantoate kinase
MKNSYNALDNLKIEASKLIDAIRSAPVKQLDSAHRIRMNATKIQMQVTRQTLEVLRKENPQAPGDVETYTKEIHLIWTNYEIQRRADKDHNYHMSRESAGWILDKLRENHQPDGIGDVSIDYWIKQRIEKNEQAKQLTETEQIVYDLTKLVADRSIDMPTESVVKGFAMSINAEVDVKRIIAELEKESN